MAPLPQISILIPVHNEEKFIGRAIRSAMNQKISRDDYEIIVIDDASTDRTPYALGLFKEDITIIRNDENLGLSASLNKGIMASKGKFIVRIDGDDFVSNDYLYMMQLFLVHNRYMDAVACDYEMIDDDENTVERVNCMERPIGCGIMFRKDQLVDLGMYDPDFLMHEDRDLLARFRKKYGVHRLELPLYRYRQHDGNMTKNKDQWNTYEQKLKVKYKDVENDQ